MARRSGVLEFVVTSMAVLTGTTGCRWGEYPQAPDPVPTAPAVSKNPENLKPKPSEFPVLPKGAGPIDEDAPKELTPTASGLYYRILRKAEGKKPTLEDKVVAHYRGWLDDGTQFDSSYAKGEPATFEVGKVVKGWQQGLPLISEGGMIELEIPSDLGYGPAGSRGVIPPNATLHFVIELKKVFENRL